MKKYTKIKIAQVKFCRRRTRSIDEIFVGATNPRSFYKMLLPIDLQRLSFFAQNTHLIADAGGDPSEAEYGIW